MKGTELRLLLVLGVWVSGCTAVAPWERGHLAKPHMALEPNPSQRALREYVHEPRGRRWRRYRRRRWLWLLLDLSPGRFIV